MTTVFETPCPLSLYSCPSLSFLPLSPLILYLSLLFLPPLPFSLLLCLPTPDAGLNNQLCALLTLCQCKLNLLHLSPSLSLSHFFSPVFLFSLPFRDYVVMRVSCLYGETFITSLFFCTHICVLSLSLALVLSLSHDVSSLFLLLVTLIRSLCEPELTCVLM